MKGTATLDQFKAALKPVAPPTKLDQLAKLAHDCAIAERRRHERESRRRRARAPRRTAA